MSEALFSLSRNSICFRLLEVASRDLSPLTNFTRHPLALAIGADSSTLLMGLAARPLPLVEAAKRPLAILGTLPCQR